MTRKIILVLILILLAICCYVVMFSNSSLIRGSIPSISQLSQGSNRLLTSVAKLETRTTTDFEKRRENLAKNIEEYNKAKTAYDALVPSDINMSNDDEIKDIYDVDFLWTIVGNYATTEGINLKFDVEKNTTSMISMKNNTASSNYIVCDLQFTITGKYINLTDFIFDLEDDDRLNFEINNFAMVKSGDDLQVTLVVKEIKVNADNLIETARVQENTQETVEEGKNTQNVNSNTTNSTNTTNTSKATNTTNTTNSTSSNNTTNTNKVNNNTNKLN